MKLSVQQIEEAAQRAGEHIRKTPLIRSRSLEKLLHSKHPLYLKAESLQVTGSFKVRGSLNKILSILELAKEKGLVAASAGNHAQGVAFHSNRLGINAKIVMPESTPLVKRKSTEAWGAEVILFGESYQESYEKALEIKRQEGREFVHAFEDIDVIAGQGTIGLEILDQCPEVQNVVTPIGGGGLTAGLGTYLKAKNPNINILAVQATGCSTFIPSMQAGNPITLEKVDTIAEGMACKKMGDLTFSICQEIVDETILVSDQEISQGVLWMLENERLFVEGCAGACLAAAIKKPHLLSGPSVILLSGGNLDVNLLARIIERGLAKSGRRFRFQATLPDVPGSLHQLINIIADQKASILHIDHERVFAPSSVREVTTNVEVETSDKAHQERVRKALNDGPWPVRFPE